MADFWVRIKGDPSHFRRGATSVKGDMQGLERQAASLKRVLLGTFAVIGVTAGIGASVRVLADFSQQMSTVQAITEATDSQLQQLRETAKQLGATTRYSASEAAQGMILLSRSGFTAAETVETVADTLRLAQAGALGLGEAAGITAGTLRAFRLPTDQASRVVDVFATAANMANTDVRQLGDGMRFVAPIAAGLGIEIETTTAAMAALSDANLQASMAGTGLRRVLSTLEATTATEEKILKELGLTTEDVRISHVGLIGALKALERAGVDTGLALKLFGDRGGPAFEVLSSSIPKIERFEARLRASGGAALRIAEIMDENLNGALFAARSAFEAVIIAIGDLGAESVATQFMRGLADQLRWVARNMDTVAKYAKIAGTVLGVYLVNKGIMLVIAGVRALGVAVATNPLGLLVLAITVVIAYLVQFRDELAISTDGLVTLGDLGSAAIETLSAAFGSFFALFSTGMDEVEETSTDKSSKLALGFIAAVRAIATALDVTVGAVVGAVGAIIFSFGKIPRALGDIFTRALNNVVSMVESAINGIIRGINRISGIVGIPEIPEVELARIKNNYASGAYELGTTFREVFLEGFNSRILTDTVDRMLGTAEQKAFERLGRMKDEIEGTAPAPGLVPTPPPGAEREPGGVTGLDPAFTERLAALRQEGELLRLNAGEYAIQQGLLQFQSDLKRQLTTDEHALVEEQLRLNQALLDQAMVYDEITAPIEEFQTRVQALSSLLQEGKISWEQYTLAMDEARMVMLQTGTDMESGIQRGLLTIKKQIMDVSSHAEQVLVRAFNSAGDALTEFVTTGSADFRKFATDILHDIMRLMFHQLMKDFLQFLGSAGGGSAGTEGGLLAGLFGFQRGGSFVVGGAGGPDSQLVAFRGSPGERVDVTPQGKASSVTVTAPQINQRIVNVIDPRLAIDALESAEGEQVVINVIRRNRNTIGKVLATY